jgi:Alpha-L-arabinofuranosidase
MNTHNTFDEPNAIKPTTFSDATLVDNVLEVKLPSKSVVVLTLE